MLQNDMKPVLFTTPLEFEEIEIYGVHDVHYGNEMFNDKKWEALKAEILSKPNRYVIFVGGLMENAVIGSKSDVYLQTVPPQVQKEWVAEQLRELADRTIAVIPGNHETNRSTKLCGLYPLYDCCVYAGIQDRYRQTFCFSDIAVGSGGHGKGRQIHYVVASLHKVNP